IRNGGFRRCLDSSVLDVLIRRQFHAARKHLNGRPEPLVEGGRAIVSRAGKPLLKQHVRARGGGRVRRQDGSRRGWCEQSDLGSQACQSYATPPRLGPERRAEPENVRVNCPETRKTRTG